MDTEAKVLFSIFGVLAIVISIGFGIQAHIEYKKIDVMEKNGCAVIPTSK